MLELLADSIAHYCEDCHVVRARNGLAALEQLAAHPFHLLLTDYQMPGMNGLELAQVVRERFPDMLVVLMTGFLRIPDLPEKLRTLSLDGYIEKPFDLEQIWAVLRLMAASNGGQAQCWQQN